MIDSGANRWTPENRKRLQGLLEGPPGQAVFDFDNTLIHGDLGEACMYYIAFQGLMRADLEEFWQEISHPTLSARELDKIRQGWERNQSYEDLQSHLEWVDDFLGLYDTLLNGAGLEQAYRWTRAIFGNLPEKELRSIAHYVFQDESRMPFTFEELPSGRRIPRGIRIVPEIHSLIQSMLSAGWTVRIITASPEPTIQSVIHNWNLEEAAVRGMRLKRDGDLLTPHIEEPMTYGPGKVQAIRELDQRSIDFAAGDSFTDLDMLRAAGTALLLDRGKEDLRRIANDEGFLVQSFDVENPEGNKDYRPVGHN
ncbi:MAG: haloacid dehalogenase-like hydrolase [Leptospiraceae bacterium]|nr:haloacid dehalogenase-like hydrolase [Leptospiraceae bacterium]